MRPCPRDLARTSTPLERDAEKDSVCYLQHRNGHRGQRGVLTATPRRPCPAFLAGVTPGQGRVQDAGEAGRRGTGGGLAAGQALPYRAGARLRPCPLHPGVTLSSQLHTVLLLAFLSSKCWGPAGSQIAEFVPVLECLPRHKKSRNVLDRSLNTNEFPFHVHIAWKCPGRHRDPAG